MFCLAVVLALSGCKKTPLGGECKEKEDCVEGLVCDETKCTRLVSRDSIYSSEEGQLARQRLEALRKVGKLAARAKLSAAPRA